MTQSLLLTAIRVVNTNPLGLLTTVDRDGVPHVRWMGSSTAADGLRRLYTLTGRHSRKVRQIRDNPQVCWLFSAPEQQDVVTLYGRAEILESPTAAQPVWDRLLDHARVYCMSALSDDRNLEMVTLVTNVTRVELISPRLNLYQPQDVPLSAARES